MARVMPEAANVLEQPKKEAVLIIYASVNGRDNWQLFEPKDVPQWVRNDPKLIGRLMAGEQCMDPAVGRKGSMWYRAEKVASPAPVQ